MTNSNVYELKAKILLGKGDYFSSLDLADQGLQYYMSNGTLTKKLKSILHNIKANAYNAIGQIDSSKYYFNSSLELLELPFEDDASFEDYVKYSDFNLTSFEIISDFAKYNVDLYSKTKDVKYLLIAQENYLILSRGSVVLSKLFKERGSKQSLYNKIAETYDNYLEVLIILIEEHNKEEFYETLFEVVESNKSRLLNEKLNFSHKLASAGIPDTVLEVFNSLEKDIAFIEKKKYDEQQKTESKDSISIAIWQNNILSYKDSLNILTRNLEENYPNYSKRYLANSQKLISSVQHDLGDDTRYISYYELEDKFLILNFDNESVSHRVVKENGAISKAIDILISIVNDVPASINYKERFSLYKIHASTLFLKLIEQEISSSSRENIIISPHSKLSLLPFELLISSEINNSETYRDLDYLIQNYNISYVYSSDQLGHNNNQISSSSQQSLMIAPSFINNGNDNTRDCESIYLSQLVCAEEECREIASVINGSVITNKEATTHSVEEGKSYKVLHLATHACLDNSNPMFNKIHFTDDYLSLNDIYNLDITADLVTLSACNTGSGVIEEGEGVYNLAKGFMACGANAVVSSLWSVNDCSTKDLMKLFYTNLIKGQTKDLALRNSKIQYLQSADNFSAHPYYWSGFILVGDSSPLYDSSFAFTLPHYLFFTSLFAICLFLFVRKK